MQERQDAAVDGAAAAFKDWFRAWNEFCIARLTMPNEDRGFYERRCLPTERELTRATRPVADLGERLGIDTSPLFNATGNLRYAPDSVFDAMFATVKRIEARTRNAVRDRIAASTATATGAGANRVNATAGAVGRQDEGGSYFSSGDGSGLKQSGAAADAVPSPADAATARGSGSYLRAVGASWQLRFEVPDGTIEQPPPFRALRGFELLRQLLYEPEALAKEFPDHVPAQRIADPQFLAALDCRIRQVEQKLESEKARDSRPEVVAELREELDFCNRQRAAFIQAGGTARTFSNPQRKKALDRFWAAIQSVLEETEAIAPGWTEHMRESIVVPRGGLPTYRPKTPIRWT